MRGVEHQVPRAFVSYAHEERGTAAEIAAALRQLAVKSFLAHEDIGVSEEWRDCIVGELSDAHIFVPLLSKKFKESDWTSHEIGFAFSKPDVLFLPLSVDGTKPYGLIAHIQSRPVTPGHISHHIFLDPIARRHPRLLFPALVDRLARARSFRDAESRMEPLEPFFSTLSEDEAKLLLEASIANNQIWNANRCRKMLREGFVPVCRPCLDNERVAILEHQLDHREYHPSYWGKDSADS